MASICQCQNSDYAYRWSRRLRDTAHFVCFVVLRMPASNKASAHVHSPVDAVNHMLPWLEWGGTSKRVTLDFSTLQASGKSRISNLASTKHRWLQLIFSEYIGRMWYLITPRIRVPVCSAFYQNNVNVLINSSDQLQMVNNCCGVFMGTPVPSPDSPTNYDFLRPSIHESKNKL